MVEYLPIKYEALSLKLALHQTNNDNNKNLGYFTIVRNNILFSRI
jgi:hypothetical protein